MKGSVLFVDDEPEILAALEDTFREEQGLAVRTCSDGESALAALDEQPVNVVVSDQKMPGMSGTELLAEIRKRHPRTVCMILSGFGDAAEIAEAVEAGIVAERLDKPWSVEQLRSKILESMVEPEEPGPVVDEKEEQLLLRETSVKPEHLERARRIAAHLQQAKPLTEILIELGHLTEDEHERVRQVRRASLGVPEILHLDGVLDDQALTMFRALQQRNPQMSERAILVRGEMATEEQYLHALAAKHQWLYVEPETGLVDRRLLAKASIPYLQKHAVLPVHVVDGTLHCLMSDPLDRHVLVELERMFGAPISPMCCSTESILSALNELAQREASGGGASSLQYRELGVQKGGEDGGEEAVQVVDYLLVRAIELGASDLHIEPLSNKIRVRARIDGVLRQITDLPADFAPRVASRLKVLAGADIAERRQHQDGRLLVSVEGREIDIRYSSYVAVHGENSVLRILDRSRGMLPVDQLGFERPVLEQVRDVALRTATGLVLVTGPTGSGKTTTLYSFVNYLNDESIKVITCEDPVEYQMDGVIQCAVNEKTGPTFADSLRSILRQDPDVILVGEIRDRTTAELAIEASLTGHKVLSTLHTEDAVGTVLRLLDMQLEPFMVASTLSGLIAQRLLRRVCEECRRRTKPSTKQLTFFGLERTELSGIELVEGAGCRKCDDTGFKGRMAIHEVLLPDDDLRDGILNRASSREMRALARKASTFVSLQEVGFIKAMDGVTTLGEVIASAPRDTSMRRPRELKELAERWRSS